MHDSQNYEKGLEMRQLRSLGQLKEIFREEMKKNHEGEWMEDFVEISERAKEPLLEAIESECFFGSEELGVSPQAEKVHFL